MKEKILEILGQSVKALTSMEIDNLLGNTKTEELQEVLDCLKELSSDYTIYHSNKDKYMLLEKSHLVKGILRANRKGFGFIEAGDPTNKSDDIFISKDNINGAIHNDVVLVELISKKDVDRSEGKIVKIIKRELNNIVGEFYYKQGVGHVDPDDSKVNIDIEIENKYNKGCVNGHKVVVEIVKHVEGTIYQGKIVKVLGHKNDPGVDILSIVYKYNIDSAFDEDTIKELDNIPDVVEEKDLIGRTDFRDEVIFTIDGDDTKDIDDAISVKKLENGNYQLGVHIADVSYYIKENSAIDIEAMDRGTSVYLVDRVIPMLPHKLSNGICSLNPNVDRLAISCIMELNTKGKVVDYNICESVITSRIQMTYKKVNLYLEQGVVSEGYEPYTNELTLMHEISGYIRDMKTERGYLDFDTDEAKIIVDENCHPIDIKVRERGIGENMIEDFMIAANETVAEHIFHMELPFIYRIHEYPKEEKIRNYLTFIQSLGYVFNGNMKDTNPKSLQKLLEFIKDKKEFKILSSLLLRNMQKAVYKPQNIGHYGLASKCYTHFTSPIRRYPDTTVHRLLRTYLFQNKMDSNTLNHWSEKLIFVSDNSSLKERSSINCEREVEDMKFAEYMQDHIGEEFDGMISSVMSFGLFVQLDNLIEGLVPIKDMDDFYHFDDKALLLKGEKTGKVYKIGDRLRVKVKKASKVEQIIDFEIVKKSD